MQKILVVEDDKKISRLVYLLLQYEGYEVSAAFDGKEALDKMKSENYDLILLDIMMPRMNGIEFCRKVRESSDIPIIIISAKDEVSDKVIGLELGADDYVSKPFSNEELLARVKSLLRRCSVRENSELLVNGKLTINLNNFSVCYNNEKIELSKTEFDLLELLVRNRGLVLTRDNILNTVWGFENIGNDNLLDVYIKYLRDKIDKRFNIKLINTVRGIGYTVEKL